MRGQQGAAGEVIELLAQKSGSHPMGIMALGMVFWGMMLVYNLKFQGHCVKVPLFQASVEMSNKIQSLWGVQGHRSYLYLYITNP